MGASSPRTILALNTGSSSLKAGVFATHGEDVRRVVSLAVTGLGGEARFRATDGDGKRLEDRKAAIAAHDEALHTCLEWLGRERPEHELKAVGHRIVHGGPDHETPERVDERLLADLRRLIPFAPDHLPPEIDGLEIVSRRLPELPQVVCFDTAFHRHLPAAARVFPLPREVERAGCVRYGFHGLSFEFIVSRLAEQGVDPGALVIAHLGSGASMAAVRDGRSIDTTMGFTPLGGLVMSTRSGDLDPGVLIYLLREWKLSVEELNTLLNKQAGLAGIGDRAGDMKALLAAASDDRAAALAVEVFCRTARKHLAAMAAALGGLDTVVFTGGIGERAPKIRSRICEGTAFLGMALDPAANASGAPRISSRDSRVTVRVIATDEEAMIARHTATVLARVGSA